MTFINLTSRTGKTTRLLQRAQTEIERGNKVCLVFPTKIMCEQFGISLRGKLRPSDIVLGTPTELGLNFRTMKVEKYPEENLVVLVDHGVLEQYFHEGFNQLRLQEPTINLSFEQALVYLKNGKRTARCGWKGKGVWVEMVDATDSLNAHLRIKNVRGSYDTWVPSISDLLAEDWRIAE